MGPWVSVPEFRDLSLRDLGFRDRQRARGAGEPEHGVQVHAGGDGRAEGVDHRQGVAAALGGGDEAEMPGRDGEGVQAADRAEDGDARALGGGGEQVRVVVRADLVEDHAAEARRGVEGREAVQQGGDRRADAGRVDHQHDRRASSRATCAVEAKSSRSDAAWLPAPSNRPITPSMTAMSASVGVLAPWANIAAIRSSPTSQGSRLRPGRPAASAW